MKKLTVEDYFNLIKNYNLIAIRLQPDNLMIIKDDWNDRLKLLNDYSFLLNTQDKVQVDVLYIYEEPIRCNENELQEVLSYRNFERNDISLFTNKCSYKIIEAEEYDQQVYDSFRTMYKLMPKESHRIKINVIKNHPVKTIKIDWTLNLD